MVRTCPDLRFTLLLLPLLLLPRAAYATGYPELALAILSLLAGGTALLFAVGLWIVGRGNRLWYALTVPLLLIAYWYLIGSLTSHHLLGAEGGVLARLATPLVAILHALLLRGTRRLIAKRRVVRDIATRP